MKMLPLVLIASVLTLTAHTAPPVKVQITVDKNRATASKNQGGGEGSQKKVVEKVSYDIKVQNRTFADLANLSVEYVIFVERQKLGEKKNVENVERVSGSKTVASLGKVPQTVTTDEFDLVTENLVGNYIYSDGGRIKAKDSVQGVWVRVMENGQIVGELINPATMAKRGWSAGGAAVPPKP